MVDSMLQFPSIQVVADFWQINETCWAPHCELHLVQFYLKEFPYTGTFVDPSLSFSGTKPLWGLPALVQDHGVNVCM